MLFQVHPPGGPPLFRGVGMCTFSTMCSSSTTTKWSSPGVSSSSLAVTLLGCDIYVDSVLWATFHSITASPRLPHRPKVLLNQHPKNGSLRQAAQACVQIRVPPRSCFWGSFLEKILVLTDFDQMLTPPQYTSLESSGSQLSPGISWKKQNFILQSVRFLGMPSDRIVHSSWQCVIRRSFQMDLQKKKQNTDYNLSTSCIFGSS